MKTELEQNFRILIAGGGTGGHLFPGVAVAKECRKRYPAARILFVTGRKKIEADILTAFGFEQVSIMIEGLKGRGWLKALKVMVLLPISLWQSLAIIRRFNPQVVLGVGGYSSGPVCLAARLVNVPAAIQEQNSYPGLTNRLLCRIVDKVFIAYQESGAYFAKGDPVFSGNPVREEIVQQSGAERKKEQDLFTILILGGSQGAKAVNRAMVEALVVLGERNRKLRVIHQTGTDDYEAIRAAYEQKGLKAEVRPFIEEMAWAYGQADLAVSRAGASTLAELAVLGKPSILIPFPLAANNHQETNAAALVRVGGAEMILQKDLNGTVLADTIEKYLQDPQALAQMSARAAAIGKKDAVRIILDQLAEMRRS
ncbi:MAG: undecaprenyldiphospho-muramoylpentapeptide beta-N-acetylglucosaminyltransferase [Desulfobacteraceae bacterium]|nr:MAG: undecaprenyldiphospho-muramoylpentapeptide beta-N-acetylglucosaminyltransferase [Desulfobacteraceae bacterium]